MTEPQLSAEMEKRFDKFILEVTNEKSWIEGMPVYDGYAYVTLANATKHFLATALEEQRLKYLEQVKAMTVVKHGRGYLLDYENVLTILNGKEL